MKTKYSRKDLVKYYNLSKEELNAETLKDYEELEKKIFGGHKPSHIEKSLKKFKNAEDFADSLLKDEVFFPVERGFKKEKGKDKVKESKLILDFNTFINKNKF